MITILNNKGVTLVESLLAFSVFITCVVMILSLFTMTISVNNHNNNEFKSYYQQEMEKEKNIWVSQEFASLIPMVLH